MAEGLGTGGRQAIVLVFGRKQRQRVATGVGAVLIAAGVAVSAAPPMANAAACATTPLVLTWDSTKAATKTVALMIRSAPTTVDWGDGTTPTSVAAAPTNSTQHTYASTGTYTISICGVVRFGLMGGWTQSGANGFTTVTSFPTSMLDLEGAFMYWGSLTDVPTTFPTGVTTLASAFKYATTFNDPDIGSWSTSSVTDFSRMFEQASTFNQNIGAWNTGSATTLTYMFANATAFNNGGSPSINNWNTSNVTSLAYTFSYSAAFNQPIGGWNVAKVTTLQNTFDRAELFNQDLGTWNTGAVTTLKNTFSASPLGSAFNNGGSPSINNWNTSRVATLEETFKSAKAFNQPIGSWDTSSVTTLQNAFASAEAFNQDIGTWNTSLVTAMGFTFNQAKAFNNGGSDAIKNWNTSRVTNMAFMFSSAPFNQPIGSWDTGAVTLMSSMFKDATAFDQDISTWNPGSLTSAATMWAAQQSVMSVANYDKLLIAWSGKVLKPSVAFGWGKHKYSCAAEAARSKLTSTPNSWTVTDGGLLETAPTISTIVPGDKKLSVYFTAPTCVLSTRTTYQYSIDGGTNWVTVSPSSLSSPIVITGLTNGQTYPIKVRPINGTSSDAVNGTPANGAIVTAKNETSVYGAAVPTIGYTSTLATGDWVSTVTCGAYTDNTYATAVTSSTKPGTYLTRCTGSTTSGLGSTITYTNGTYTVTKAPLTVTAKSFTKTYGDVLTLDGTSDFTVSGLIGSDAVASVTLTTSGKPAAAGVAGSPYPIVPSAAVGAASQVLGDWYSITYNNGSITVNKAAALSVTAKTYTIDLGDTSLDAATLGFDESGFVNSETFATAGYTVPTCGVYDGATLKSPPYSTLAAGTYTVKCSGGAAGNYAGINYSDAKFVVKAADISVTAKVGSSTYGSAPALETGYEVLGDLNGAVVSCKAYVDNAFTVQVTAATPPGKYLTHCTGPADNGAGTPVALVYTDGVYTVEKAPLTITAKSHTKTYGDVLTFDADLSDGSTDVTVTGLVNGDAVDSVTLTTSGGVATAGVAGSPYPIVPSAAVLDCECDIEDLYDITYVDGTITVGRKTLTVTATNVNLAVGAPVPTAYEFTATGWENGENDTTKQPAGWVAPTCTSSFNSTTPLGTAVDITCSGGSADDYEFSFVKGSVTLGNPEVTVQNTTTPAVETSGATANVALKATITNWAPGCKVTFTLSPSVGTASPYTVYTTASNEVSVAASLPVGVYDIVTSVSEGCAGTADTTGIVAVVPIGPGGAAHVDTYGTRYRDTTTGKTVTLNMEWLRKQVRTRNPVTGLYESRWVNESYYNWSIYGANQWRIAVKPFSGSVTLTDGDPTSPQTATVSTWGRMACPDGMYPAGSVSICSAVTNIVMLQEWVPRPSNPKYGTWRNVGEVLIVEKLAEGLWPYRCATLACKTPLPDYVAFQMRPVPGSSTPTVIPVGLPASTDWTRVTYGEVLHKQA